MFAHDRHFRGHGLAGQRFERAKHWACRDVGSDGEYRSKACSPWNAWSDDADDIGEDQHPAGRDGEVWDERTVRQNARDR